MLPLHRQDRKESDNYGPWCVAKKKNGKVWQSNKKSGINTNVLQLEGMIYEVERKDKIRTRG
jgi:hypothetical protein